MDGSETDRLSEEERDARSDRIVLTRLMDDLKTEKNLLNQVRKSAVELKKNDRKIERLIEDILPNRLKDSSKIIIFTRYIDTLRYIDNNLRKKIDSSSLKFKTFSLGESFIS